MERLVLVLVMATEGAALSHLRDAYYILTHDLGDLEPLVKKGDPVTVDDAKAIAPVVSKLALSMMKFGLSVDAAQDLVNSGRKSTYLMMGVVLVIMITFFLGGLFGLYKIVVVAGIAELTGANIVATLFPFMSSLVSPVGGVIMALTALMVFMMCWYALLSDKLNQLKGPEAVLRSGFWRVRNNVSGAFAMRFEAAAQQGTLDDFKNGSGDWRPNGYELQPNPDCEDPDGIIASTTAHAGCGALDACSVLIPTLPEVILKSCPGEVVGMLAELQRLKLEGVDSFDRMALWKTISAGIDSIRKSVSVSADANVTTIGAETSTSKDIDALIENDILGLMKDEGLKAMVTAWVAPSAPTAAVQAATEAERQAMIRLGRENGTIDSVHAQITATKAKAAADRSKNLSTDQLALITEGRATSDSTVREALKQVDAILDKITSEVLVIVQSRDHVFDITNYRVPILASLKQFYGADFVPLRRKLNIVIDRVQNASDARPPSATKIYVDSATMFARVHDMGPAAWDRLVASIDATRDSVRLYMTRFQPAGLSTLSQNITRNLTVGIVIFGLVGLVIYAKSVIVEVLNGTISKPIAVRTVIIAASLFALMVLAVHGMISRVKARREHNSQAISRNGQKLVSSLETCVQASTMISDSQSLTATDAQRYITAAAGSVRAYESCNSITNGARLMPFPTMDLIIYGFVVAMILASALYAINKLGLRQKIANIRTLSRLRDRVMDGAIPPGLVKQIECSSPDGSHREVFVWLAVLVLFAFNIYAMTNIKASENDYKASLLLVDDCV